MFKDLPMWFAILNTIALGIGYVVLLFVLARSLRPLLRGLSYGLWETVVFYKCGVSFHRVIKRLLKAVFINFPFWGLVNSTTSSITNNLAGWRGVFGWSFKPGFTRANSIREEKEKLKNPAPVASETKESDNGDFFDDEDDK